MIQVLTPRPFSEVIETPRLILRRHRLELATMIYNAIDGDRRHLGRFLPWVEQTKSVEDESAYIARSSDEWQRNEKYDFGLFLKANNVFIGTAGLHTISWHNQRAEIGYWILSQHEGQGYISEAVDVLTAEAFKLGFHRLEIRCEAGNERSANVPKRLGYRLEARLEDEAVVGGVFRDTLVFSLLRGRHSGK